MARIVEGFHLHVWHTADAEYEDEGGQEKGEPSPRFNVKLRLFLRFVDLSSFMVK